MPRVVFRFNGDQEVPLLADLRAWLKALLQCADSWDPSFEPYEVQAVLDNVIVEEQRFRVEKALVRDARYRPPFRVMERFYQIDGIPQEALDGVITVLRRVCRLKPVYEAADLLIASHISPALNSDAVNQSYLDAAPRGIDSRYAWNFNGGDGAAVRLIDVEYAWNLREVDLVDSAIVPIMGVNPKGDSLHGTAVLGLIAAPDNSNGVTGIAHGIASILVISAEYGGSGVNLPQAVVQAVLSLRFGDVLLLELQIKPGSDFPLGPCEQEPALFEAIRLATALGVTVIEPAGNGGRPLGMNPDRSGSPHDSGAILVGAAANPKLIMGSLFLGYERWCGSNYGDRVDCYSFGENALTVRDWSSSSLRVEQYSCREGKWINIELRQLLTSDLSHSSLLDFDGTSAASAIVAGAAVVLQSLAHINLGFAFSPWQARLILSSPTMGTPSLDGDTTFIGVMPDLKKIIDNTLNLPPYPYFRDRVGDNGERLEIRQGLSPDILFSPREVPDPQGFWGEDSSQENNDRIGAELAASNKPWIYVRLRNRGGEEARGVRVTLFWAPVATLLLPSHWIRVGKTVLPCLPYGDLLTVSEGIGWERAAGFPSKEHVTWIALTDDGDADLPQLKEPKVWDDFRSFLGDSRKELRSLAIRNLHFVQLTSVPALAKPELTVESNPAAYLRLPFLVPGVPGLKTSRVEVLAGLPREAKVWLEMPNTFCDLQGIWGDPVGKKRDSKNVFCRANPNGVTPFREGIIDAGQERQLRLVIYLPQELRNRSYQIAVRHLAQDRESGEKEREVGRVTWRLQRIEPDKLSAPPSPAGSAHQDPELAPQHSEPAAGDAETTEQTVFPAANEATPVERDPDTDRRDRTGAPSDPS
jgi:serine protease